jgi:hypothetical protein
MLKPAMEAYNASATADPSPEKRPDRQPLVMVRWTHKTFTGPTGAVMINPASRPRMRSSRPFIESGAPIGNRRHLVSPFQDRSYGTESLIMPRLDVGGDGRRRSWRFSKLGIPPTQDVGRRKRLPHGWPQSGLEDVGRRKRLPHGWPTIRAGERWQAKAPASRVATIRAGERWQAKAPAPLIGVRPGQLGESFWG